MFKTGRTKLCAFCTQESAASFDQWYGGKGPSSARIRLIIETCDEHKLRAQAVGRESYALLKQAVEAK